MKKQREAAAWKQWVDTATHSLRMHPDFVAARRELLDHLEDKAADLTRIFPGMTQEEAQERALSGMGDPEEIDRELARAHSKLWGGLYWLVKGLVLLTALITLVILPPYLWMVVFPLAFPWWPF